MVTKVIFLRTSGKRIQEVFLACFWYGFCGGQYVISRPNDRQTTISIRSRPDRVIFGHKLRTRNNININNIIDRRVLAIYANI